MGMDFFSLVPRRRRHPGYWRRESGTGRAGPAGLVQLAGRRRDTAGVAQHLGPALPHRAGVGGLALVHHDLGLTELQPAARMQDDGIIDALAVDERAVGA